MYTVVLATMLSAGSATPAWHHHRACHSCYSSCYSCYSSCHGCYGGYSGYSGYSGYACSSCYSSCSSCHRIFPIFHNHCHSCYCSRPAVVYYSSCSVCSSCCYSAPVVVAPCCGTAAKVVPVPAADPNKGKGEQVQPPVPGNTAKVTVELPSEAKLWVDNVPCPLTSSVRSFNTPTLNPNQQYVYSLKVEVVRDGRPVSETQRVVITPGRETRVDFNSSAVVGTAAR